MMVVICIVILSKFQFSISKTNKYKLKYIKF